MAAKVAKLSAGILLFHRSPDICVLLAHPGGPFWARKDDGAWSIPKGLYEPGVDADPLMAAVREFTEEVGVAPPPGPFFDLGQAKLASAKIVTAWAVEGDLDASAARSNTFELEWPPKSGRLATYPEVDRVEWFTLDVARRKLSKGQLPLLEQLPLVLRASER